MYYDGDIDHYHLVKKIKYYDEKDGGGKEKEENYKNGYLDGKYYEWDKNGGKIFDRNYKDGNLEGKQLRYYVGGDGLIDQESYYKNGKKDGELKIYDHWNNIMRIMTYKEGIEVSDTIIPMK